MEQPALNGQQLAVPQENEAPNAPGPDGPVPAAPGPAVPVPAAAGLAVAPQDHEALAPGHIQVPEGAAAAGVAIEAFGGNENFLAILAAALHGQLPRLPAPVGPIQAPGVAGAAYNQVPGPAVAALQANGNHAALAAVRQNHQIPAPVVEAIQVPDVAVAIQDQAPALVVGPIQVPGGAAAPLNQAPAPVVGPIQVPGGPVAALNQALGPAAPRPLAVQPRDRMAFPADRAGRRQRGVRAGQQVQQRRNQHSKEIANLLGHLAAVPRYQNFANRGRGARENNRNINRPLVAAIQENQNLLQDQAAALAMQPAQAGADQAQEAAP